ncbi:phosphoglycerate dehydrogenase-like enzyme [Novosphingobium chloroacetimidivorans]|uniref:Phosphoglycerate dehydrogenase-like enzyme n=1 Tax=Novosphingobium chloroacetimidivorans TaxID=1428314 RepID=A0A7W7KBD7_9SPHN|nr:NAD(P)-dependent oxidoreductase [Novosphingobium chloroacetimidivorans]MBB4859063.1 phosphoglycerate dehydrogenase-like enzyme [Novosphingobium chloroacetimidivorans]
MTFAVFTETARPFIEGRLPAGIDAHWFETFDELPPLMAQAEIAWIDVFREGVNVAQAVREAPRLRWLNTVAAGINHLPLDLMAQRGTVLTNGAGLHAGTIAEYALLGMLTIVKGYREVVRAQDRHEWLHEPPGRRELAGTSALIVGAGAIGGRIGQLLRVFDVGVTEVRRSGAPGTLRVDEWRSRLADFDWVIVAVPSTPDTHGMIGAAEFAAMKPGAVIMNFARGEVIETEALLAAIDSGHLGGAFLDVTDPEPLPPEHPLWARENVHISMHLSGRSQETIFQKGAERFLGNLDRYLAGEPMEHVVDLQAGY